MGANGRFWEERREGKLLLVCQNKAKQIKMKNNRKKTHLKMLKLICHEAERSPNTNHAVYV